MGKRKIEMKMVTKSTSRQVTFSKRRNGLFKKAYELAILCGIQLAIIAFSPGGKPFAFGYPNVETVARRFENDDSNPLLDDHNASPEDFDKQLTNLQKMYKAEKKKRKKLERAMKKKYPANVNAPLEDLTLQELQNLKELLEGLRAEVEVQREKLEVCSSLLELGKRPVLAADLPDANVK